MKRRSIRWQLPLSYAGIACIAALSLGTVLIHILDNFYTQRELDNLNANAETLSGIVSNLMEYDAPTEDIEEQLSTFSFFSDTRIKLFDPKGVLLADTGENRQFFLNYSPEVPSHIIENTSSSWYVDDILVENVNADPSQVEDKKLIITSGEIAYLADEFAFLGDLFNHLPGSIGSSFIEIAFESMGLPVYEDAQMIPLNTSLYGFSFGTDTNLDFERARSRQSVQATLRDQDDNIALGTIQLSEGPSYGSEILESVRSGWMLAGGFSVIFAALVGWFISRRITQPLIALTSATSHMAQGDLTVRVSLQRRDELGVLSSAFNNMAGQIETVITTLRRFVADAAHELHTPLTALRTNVELSHEKIQSKETALALEQIKRMQSLADDLLDLSRIESQLEATEPVRMTPLVEELSVIYASCAEQKDVNFTLNLPDSTEIVGGNPSQLRRMVSNLMDNAVKFTPSGGQVHVDLRTQNGTLTLQVKDTGIGIPTEDIPYLFGRFHRGRNTANYPGSGLGLAIADAVVSVHHGKVTVHSGDNGTCFCVHLPILSV